MATNTNILFPQTPFIDVSTGRPSLPWVLWLQNPSFVNINLANALPISSGGTGISTAPTNGQLLIGNAGNYSLHTLTPSSGISVTNGAGLITVANTGVLSNIASSGISVSGATGNVTIANTGVLSAIAGSGISVSGATGNVTFANTGVLSFSGGSTGLTPATATTGAVSLAGTLAVAYGGTGQTTYTDGQLLIGNTTGNTLAKSILTAGTGISISNGHGSITIANTLPSLGGTVTSVSVVSANGLAGTVATSTTTPAITLSTTITGLLKGNGTAISAATSGTDYAPATSGTSILYGNGSGGFSNVTIGSGISFATGTLSATGSGGTVTSVALSLPSIFTVSGSPVTGTGTLTGTFNTQTANYVFAGPTTGSSATPTFRALVSADIPSLSYVSSITSSTLTVAGTSSIPTINLTSGIVTAGTTGSVTLIPVITVDTYGRVTAVTTAANPQGTVTSVAALTLGTTGTDLSSTVANGTTTPVITLNVPTASATNRGALSSTDWTTFNNKGSGSVTSVSGTGTVNGITLTGTVTSSGSLTLGGTLGSIANSQLSNSTISGVSLGSNLFSLTAGTGVSFSAGTTYNGSAAITITATGSGGTVTSVSGTSPISSSGGTTPTISITQSSATTNGYLSSTDWSTFNNKGSGSVTSVSFTGGIISVATATTTPALTVAGTSGGIPYFSSATTWATSAALTANALVIGGGAAVAPSTTTTGTGVLTALGINVGSAGAFVTFNGALGTPSSGTVTNLTGTAAINITGTAPAGTLTGTTLNSTVVTSSLTTVGTIGTGIWQGTAVTAGYGGTGQSTYAVGDILYASAATTLSKLADVATGNALISGGVTTAPSWGKIGLTTHVSGILPVANGGTNASTASITSFNNITGYSASGATGTTSTNLVFSTSPTLVTPTLGAALATSIKFGSGAVLNDYEEGTWTPADASGASLSLTINSAIYTKIGRMVNCTADITYPSTTSTAAASLTLPFVIASGGFYSQMGPPIRNNASLSIQVFGLAGTTPSTFIMLLIGQFTNYASNVQLTGGRLEFSFTYQTT